MAYSPLYGIQNFQNETGGTTEVALALLPDGIAEGTVLIFENFEYRIKENMP